MKRFSFSSLILGFMLPLLPFRASAQSDLQAQVARVNFCEGCSADELQYSFDATHEGCSIYCELDTVDIFGSSTSTCGGISPCEYNAANLHDGELSTSWAEGVPDIGVGEYFEAVFYTQKYTMGSPLALNGIEFYNGHFGTQQSWREHGRVRTLKLFVNDEYYALIHLLDVRKPQVVTFKPIPLAGADLLVLRFEIVESYPGTKFSETCLSELVFQGTGHVHRQEPVPAAVR